MINHLKRAVLIGVALCLIASPGVSLAEWMDGETLYVLYIGYSSQNKDASTREASGTYFGYVLGVINATDAIAKNKIYCLPPAGTGASNGQLAHVVGAYLVANSNERKEPAMALIYKALNRAYPCS